MAAATLQPAANAAALFLLLQLVRSLTVCRVLVVPRPAYAALAQDFPLSSTAMLEALQKNAEQVGGADLSASHTLFCSNCWKLSICVCVTVLRAFLIC
jgi:hypothetical protein